MAQVDAMFCHHQLLGLVQTDVLVIFFNPCLSQMSSLTNVHFLKLSENAVNIWCFQSQIILNWSMKAGELTWRETHHLDVMLR
jgi:hypothetical protein